MASVGMPGGMGSAGEWLPELDIKAPGKQRRLTVFFRLLLLIPQYIVLLFLGIAAFFVAIFGWFAALFTGRLPGWAALYLSQYIEYYTRVAASESLLIDRYPPFAFVAPDYPVQVELRPDELNRLAVLLRIVLIIPAGIIQAVVAGGWAVASFFIWLVVLVLGRMPESLFDATAAVVRYSMRVQAYWLMLTSSYPKRLFGDGQAAESPGAGRVPGTRPLLMTSGARVLMVVFIVLGIGYLATGGSASWTSDNNSATGNVAHP
ncbi:MAG TPA: DUF4389 domain-containing protein [Streptosporangiaceae bacterium]|nr:DUF4389 domain-containing protein [Streptosporangiaceae bacterium]